MEFRRWPKVLSLTFVLFVQLAQCAVYLQTKLGHIKGTRMHSRSGREFQAFFGLPFAKPPVGELRFQNPQPITEPWMGTLDATKYPPLCPQILGTEGFRGEEDCLYLNVYTPFPSNETYLHEKLPVWVWLYPGRRLFGDTHPYHYGPEYIMDKPVIFVCANYRMNVVGFFSTEDESASGNYGLKDQTAALKWVQKHISEFGGDPSNVTITGESSAAVDVSLHLFSPLSKGLFHRAIAQSGHAMNYRAIVPSGQNLKRAWDFAKLVGCRSVEIISTQRLVECIRRVPIKILTIYMYGLMYDYILPHTFFGVNIEKKNDEGAFITEHPMINMNEENSVPWILGINTDEGSQKLLGVYSKPEELNHVLKNYERIFPEILGYNYFPNASKITEILLDKYVGNKPLSAAFEELSQIFGFASIKHGMIESARYYKGPKYFYHFDYLHTLPYVRVYRSVMKWHTKQKTGVIHGEELRCLFNQPRIFPPILEGSDRKISDLVIDMWYNFVAFGDPNGKKKRKVWKPISSANIEYLYINETTLEMRSNPCWDEYNFWKNIGSPPLLKPDLSLELFKDSIYFY